MLVVAGHVRMWVGFVGAGNSFTSLCLNQRGLLVIVCRLCEPIAYDRACRNSPISEEV